MSKIKDGVVIAVEYIENAKESLRKYLIGYLGEAWIDWKDSSDFDFFFNVIYLENPDRLMFYQTASLYKAYIQGVRRGKFLGRIENDN